MKITSSTIPGLGQISFQLLGFFLLVELSESIQAADENQKAYEFTHRALSASLKKPSLSPQEIAKLPQDTLKPIIDIAVDEWDIREEFEQTSSDLSYPEKLYQAHQASVKKMRQHFEEVLSRVANLATQQQAVMAQSIADITQASLSPINQLLDQLQAEFNRSLASFWDKIQQYHDQAEIASSEISGLMIQAGFWFSPSGSLKIIHSIHELKDQGQATPENVRRVVVEVYERDNFSNLKSMVESWSKNPYFANRMHVIRDALEAHMEGKYTLSVPALLPLVEGILTEIVGRRATRAEGISGWAVNAIQSMYMDMFHESSKDALVAFVSGSSVYGNIDAAYFTPSTFPTWLANQGLDGQQILQRHAILHGVQTDYNSKENSLRAFLILDVLSWLKREEWDKKLQFVLDQQK